MDRQFIQAAVANLALFLMGVFSTAAIVAFKDGSGTALWCLGFFLAMLTAIAYRGVP